jgi:uncharacterized protein YbaA (DUF1428 family)
LSLEGRSLIEMAGIGPEPDRTGELEAKPTHAKEAQMAHYVDGFVVPVPLRNLNAYRRMAGEAGKIWMEHGALQYWECSGDDVKPGKVTSFPQSVQLKDDEIVVFAWIVYHSREHRDSVNAKVMEDTRMKDMMDPKTMPFDGMRMFWGGFKSLVELSSGPDHTQLNSGSE